MGPVETSGRILIGGDVCPVPSNADLFGKGDLPSLFGEKLLGKIGESEGLILNLEVPLTDSASRITKSGPCLIAPSSSINALGALPLLCVGLANNHILDQGPQGLESTVSALDTAGIRHVGAGRDLRSASEPVLLDVAGLRVGVCAFAEHEFTIAGPGSPGANPFDAPSALGSISEVAGRCDRVVVLYHGMKEYYRYPSPRVRESCRAMVDAGASLVVCQHSHCVGCGEEYGGGFILYGEGDFCFAKGDQSEERRTGLLLAYDPASGDVGLLPLVNDGRSVRLAEGGSAEEIIGGFHERSREISRAGFVEGSWASFCEGLAAGYASQLVCALAPRWLSLAARAVWRLRPRSPRFRGGPAAAALLNVLQCEAHNEALSTVLRGRLDDASR